MRRGSLVSRMLALALLAALVFGAVRLIALPLAEAYQQAAQSIAQSQTLLQRYQALAAERPQLEERVAAQREATVTSAVYLEGESDALAGAALQDQVRTIIARAGGELNSTQILPVAPAGPDDSVRRASLKLQLTVDIEGLQQLLYELETAEPYLFVDDLIVRERRLRRLRDGAGEELMLDVSFEISGYLRAAGARTVG